MLYYLIYFSKATQLMSDEALEVLLKQARTRNREFVITGMLVYVEGKAGIHKYARFVQVLEGSRFLVESLFEKISKDGRHWDIVVLKRAAISKRNFKSWDMGFEWIDLESSPQLQSFFAISEDTITDEFRNSDAVLEFLKKFNGQSQLR